MLNQLDGLVTEQDIDDLAASEMLVFDDEDRRAVLESTTSIDVQACPGSGKTTLIAAKLMLLAKKWPYEDRGICVLSHTNVAKEEIISRLKRSKTIESQNLLSYPHFIGTIQEFVGKYIAFPSIRSDGRRINLVDTDACVNIIQSRLNYSARIRVEQHSQYSNALYDFDLSFVDGIISIKVPTFKKTSASNSYRNLLSTRQNLLSEGYFFYRDIFTYAQKALHENETLASILRGRFPCVFLDEMQDTQKFQDDLLRVIFPINSPSISVQRFGDPDQAIFNGIGSEKPNESFNGKSANDMNFVIHKSHRFTNGVAEKIAKLSFNKIPLESELSDEHLDERRQLQADANEFENTILVFDDASISSVIPSFLEIVSQQFSDDYILSDNFTVKVIGAVGNEITQDDQLKIGHYWHHFDKEKSVKNFRENTLIEAVRHCRTRTNLDWSENYKFLISCIIKLLRSAGIHDPSNKYFNATTLREHLTQDSRWERLRKLFQVWLNPARELDQFLWNKTIDILKPILGLNSTRNPNPVAEYLTFREPQAEEVDVGDPSDTRPVPLPDNALQHPKGFRVELSTIHGVKGETHDATLVLETKNHCYDLQTMLPYVLGDFPNEKHPNTELRAKPSSKAAFKPNQTFMRQFYVGMSRPKHLLGLAIHTDRISDDQKTALTGNGWRIVDVTQQEE